ncbi:MAG TPA: O-methyltransferase [Candidatus Paceibacterota bacterium]
MKQKPSFDPKKFIGKLKKKANLPYLRKWYIMKRSKVSKQLMFTSKLNAYIENLLYKSETSDNAFAIKMAARTEQAYMQIPYSQGRFFEFLIKATKAKNVIEVGVFKGFSTTFIARALPKGGVVFACDRDARPIAHARRLWNHFGLSEKVHFELGEADEILKRLSEDKPSIGYFDMAFIDAGKEGYRSYVEACMKLVRKGGVLVIDNTLWKGLVQYENPSDNGANHLKNFNAWLHETYGADAAIVPAWDGVTLLYKA